MLRRLRDQRNERQRIVLRRAQGSFEIEIHRAAVVIGDEQRVLEQQAVEAGALQRPGQFDVKIGLRPLARIDTRPGLVPAVNAETIAEEPAEMELPYSQVMPLRH